MANRKPTNINKYRKPLNINIGVIIFAVMFIYIIICVFMFFGKKHITGYEVRSGSLSTSNTYTGLALRDESIISANSSGYLNFFAREGEHVACGDLVYSLDQTGRVSELLNSNSSEILLSGNDLGTIRSDLVQFSRNYSDTSYHITYDFSYDIAGTVLKLSNYNMLNNLQSSGLSDGAVDLIRAPKSGVIVYGIDGYEALSPSEITLKQMLQKDYKKTTVANNSLIGANDAVYKLINSENWSVVISVPNEKVAELEDAGYVNVKFSKNQYTSWAEIQILQAADDEHTFVELNFNNSMITFASERFIDLEVILDDDSGLKIPNSAIVEKEFYLIPKEYAVKGGNSSNNGFMREKYDDDGKMTTEFVDAGIYSESDTDYYVDTTVLRPGDYICMPDSTEKFPVSKVGTLVGVYNINKGYADFKEITVLYANDEYSIVKSNTRYGLTEYDHIVLDATTVNEDDFIYE